MASPSNVESASGTVSPFGAGVPVLPENATPEQKDLHWYTHVYQGDKMAQLTLRAVLTGGVLGMLMSASNLYTTLTVGWAFGVAITASIISFVLWTAASAITRLVPFVVITIVFALLAVGLVLVPVLGPMRGKGGQPVSTEVLAGAVSGVVFLLMLYGVLWSAKHQRMTILETNCMASTASAAGYSTGGSLATMFGALLLLAPIPEGKTASDVTTLGLHPWWLIGGFTLATGLMGVFLAIPMKRQMINHEQLPFPSGIAAAETLKSLYSGSVEAVRKAYVLVVGLGVGAIVAVLRAGEGTFKFLDSLYANTGLLIPAQLPAEGFRKINDKQLVGFGFDTSVLLLAAGMIVGLRVSLSMLLGSIILYFWLGPMLIAMDAPQLTADGKGFAPGYVPSIELVGGGTIYHLFRWGLWGGTALLVMASLTSLAFQWKTIVRAFVAPRASGAGEQTDDKLRAIEVPGMWMIVGMVPLTIAMVLIQMVAFDIAWWAGIIAVAMSFVLSMVACRATGETDTTPMGAMGKVMQLLFAVLKPGQVAPNLASAGIAANAAASSADLLTDLKIGYLLGANPRRQFIAQFFGVFFGTLAIVPIWYLMVPNRGVLEDKFAAPATQTWAKVAQVLTKGLDFLPDSAKLAILIGAGVGVLLPVIERFVVPPKHRKWMPSATGLGLSFMLPFANSLSFTIGAIISWIWGRLHKPSNQTFNVPLASGLVAGESLIAAAIAMLATAAGLMGWVL